MHPTQTGGDGVGNTTSGICEICHRAASTVWFKRKNISDQALPGFNQDESIAGGPTGFKSHTSERGEAELYRCMLCMSYRCPDPVAYCDSFESVH